MRAYVRHDMRPRRVHVVVMHMEPARSAAAIRALRSVLLVLLFAQFVPLLPFPQRLLVLGGLLACSHLLRARVVGHLQTSQHGSVIRMWRANLLESNPDPKEQGPERPKSAERRDFKAKQAGDWVWSHHCLSGLLPPELLRAAESVGECRLVVARVVVQQTAHDRVAVLGKPTGRLREDNQSFFLQQKMAHQMKDVSDLSDKSLTTEHTTASWLKAAEGAS